MPPRGIAVNHIHATANCPDAATYVVHSLQLEQINRIARHGLSLRVADSVVSIALRSAPRTARPSLFFPCDTRRRDAPVVVVAATGMCMSVEFFASTLRRPRRAAERAKASTCRTILHQAREVRPASSPLFR